MCLIILQTNPDIHVKKKNLLSAYNNNPHGVGIAVVDDGILKPYKGMPDFNSFYSLYKDLLDYKSPMLVHFRFCSHGDIDISNTHPFMVADDLVFAHNGVIDMPSDHTKSDTKVFCDEVLRNIPRDTFNSPGIWRMMQLAVGKSVLVFMFADGKYMIVNERRGHWDREHEIFYSNNSYEQQNYYTPVHSITINCGGCSKLLKTEPSNMSHVPMCDECLRS